MLAITAAAVAVVVSGAAGLDSKMLGGPPSEFKRHSIPDTALGALFQASATYFFTMSQDPGNGNVWSYETDVVVDSTAGFEFSLMSPVLQELKPVLRDPNGNEIDLEPHKSQSFWPVGDSTSEILGDVYTFSNPTVGTYHLTLSVSGMTEDEFLARVNHSRGNGRTSSDGILLVWNESEDEIFSRLESYLAMRKDDHMGFQAQMYEVSSNPDLRQAKGHVPTALRDVVSKAVLEVFFPNGTRMEEAMHDDGLHADGLANDGVYGANFVPDASGSYLVQTVLAGKRKSGDPFLRTAEHSVRVVPRSAELTGDVAMAIDLANLRLIFDLGVQQHQVLEAERELAGKYRAYFELYGKSLFSGEQVPVAWSSAIVEPAIGSNGQSVVTLEVDMGWLVAAGAVGPFSLRNVYLQEVNTFIPVSSKDTLDLRLSSTHDATLWRAFQAANATYDGTTTEKMRFGVRPKWLHMRKQNATSDSSKLVLMHGYCADANPWKRTSHIWQDALYFEDTKQSRSHDKFAKLVVDFAEKEGATSYGLLGHSQGGFVAVHVYNYYWSGVDAAEGQRKLQSLGTPYQGNSGAGFWAEVLDTLAEGSCESQEDLTRDGAQMWLSGISADVAKEMYYYTTQYDKGGLFGKGYCNKLTNAVLSSPNDGVTENAYADLEGGNFVGNFVGECHIDGMNWPASYLNEERNQEMNSKAAR